MVKLKVQKGTFNIERSWSACPELRLLALTVLPSNALGSGISGARLVPSSPRAPQVISAHWRHSLPLGATSKPHDPSAREIHNRPNAVRYSQEDLRALGIDWFIQAHPGGFNSLRSWAFLWALMRTTGPGDLIERHETDMLGRPDDVCSRGYNGRAVRAETLPSLTQGVAPNQKRRFAHSLHLRCGGTVMLVRHVGSITTWRPSNA